MGRDSVMNMITPRRSMWASHDRMGSAVDAGERATTGKPVENQTVDVKLARAYGQDGLELIRQGKFAAAEKALIRATELDAQNPLSYIHLGRLYHLRGQLREAYDAYLHAWMLEPADSMTMFEIGTVLADLGDREQAKAAFHHALRLDSGRFEARAWLARLYSEELDYEMATRLLSEGAQHRYRDERS